MCVCVCVCTCGSLAPLTLSLKRRITPNTLEYLSSLHLANKRAYTHFLSLTLSLSRSQSLFLSPCLSLTFSLSVFHSLVLFFSFTPSHIRSLSPIPLPPQSFLLFPLLSRPLSSHYLFLCFSLSLALYFSLTRSPSPSDRPTCTGTQLSQHKRLPPPKMCHFINVSL